MRPSVLVLAVWTATGCDPAPTGDPDAVLGLASTVLTGAEFDPGPEAVLWVVGRGLSDLWLGSADGTIRHRASAQARPEPVPELERARLGGVATAAVALPGGKVVLLVRRDAGGLGLAGWAFGTVADGTSDVAASPEDLEARLRGLHATPDGEAVVVLRDRADPGRVELFRWNGGSFQGVTSFAVPEGDPARAQVVPATPTRGYVVSAAGGCGLHRFELFSVSPVPGACGGVAGVLRLTGAEQGFLVGDRLQWFDGGALSPAESPAALASFPFAPDGLASLVRPDADPRPRVFVQHALAAGTPIALAPAAREVRGAGVAGRWFLAVLAPASPEAPSLVAVDLDALPAPAP